MAATARAPAAPGALGQPRERWYDRPLALPIFYGASLGHVLLALLALLAIVVAPLVLSDGFVLQTRQTIAYYTIAAIGLNVLVGYQGQVSLGHGALFAFGAYASALLTTRAGVPVWIAIFVSAGIAGFLGFLVALPTLGLRGHCADRAAAGQQPVDQPLGTDHQRCAAVRDRLGNDRRLRVSHEAED